METIETLFTSKGWFPIFGEIKQSTQYDFEKFISKQSDDLKLIFKTGGGCVHTMLEMVATLQLYKKITDKKVHGFVLSECSSAAITLLSQCDGVREGTKNANFMFHSTKGNLNYIFLHGKEATLKEFHARWERCEREVTLYRELQSAGFNLPLEKIIELEMNGEMTNVEMDAKTAKELGIIHNIVEMPSNF